MVVNLLSYFKRSHIVMAMESRVLNSEYLIPEEGRTKILEKT
jgi:hypothetical protein